MLGVPTTAENQRCKTEYEIKSRSFESSLLTFKTGSSGSYASSCKELRIAIISTCTP